MFEDDNKTPPQRGTCYYGITKQLLHAAMGVHGFVTPSGPVELSALPKVLYWTNIASKMIYDDNG